jgi:hypothetical protein
MVSDQAAQAGEARDLIHDYMRDFFPCPKCRTHFLEHYAACAYRVCDVGDTAGGAALLQEWLWRLHNAVTATVRTDAGSETEWPPRATCATCGAKYTPAVAQVLAETYLP